jgi:hypothetical protein
MCRGFAMRFEIFFKIFSKISGKTEISPLYVGVIG